jgi:type IVB pilus formation R64 PilN family outer membrane protein
MAFVHLPFMRRMLPVAMGFALVFTLSACNTEDYRNQVSERTAVAEQRVDEARLPSPARRYNPLTVTDSVWTGTRAVRMRNGIPLPERVEAGRSISLISTTPMSLRAIANAISTQTGIPVRLGKDADEGGGDDDDLANAAAASAASPSSSSSSSSSSAAKPKTAAPAAAATARNGMRIAYEGTLSGLLARISSHFGVSWKYDGGAINFSKYETRVFVLDALPGSQKVKDGLKEESDSTASSSGSAQVTTISQQAASQSSSMDIDFKFWDEIGKTVETVLGGVGSYSLSPSSGTITVVTTPEIMRTVADYMNQENDRLSRQVAINVEVYTIDINEGEDFNIKFDTALRRLADFGANFTSGGAPAAVNTQTLGSFAISVLDPEKLGSVNSVFGLLSSVGNTVRVAQFPMTTLNNRPVARRIGRDRSYLASVQTNTSQTFQNTTLTPGIIRDGFSIQVTPRILGDGRILLQYSLSLIDLLDISSFSSGQNQIQLPQTATRVFVQQSMLRSGSTLVLAGFDQDQVQQNSSGVGNPYNYLLGGGVGNRKVRQILFIAMTPQEISLPRTESE